MQEAQFLQSASNAAGSMPSKLLTRVGDLTDNNADNPDMHNADDALDAQQQGYTWLCSHQT